MNCPDCGLENPPVRGDCAFCARDLEGAEGRREAWERLGPALQAEFSAAFERALAARRAWREKLRRNRVRHAIGGAVLNAGLLGLTQVWLHEAGRPALIFLLEAAAGAALGFALNAVRGGELRGMLAFGGAYAASTLVKLALGVLRVSVPFGFFAPCGLLAALVLGYAYGLSMSLRRSIED